MQEVYQNITELIGKTPMVRLNKLEKKFNTKWEIYAKLESFNPGGSVKDRIAYSMLLNARDTGSIAENATIIEPTSGNTGVGLAMLAAYFGYNAIFVMPETASVERRGLLQAYGAEVILTSGEEGIRGSIAKANELLKIIPNSFMPSQFENPSNPQIHYKTTGVEIYEIMNGKIDVFIAGVGTGGTISGAGKYLKEKIPSIQVIAVEPEDSPILSKGISGKHKIQGIGTGFIPKNLDTSIYNEVIRVSNEEAFSFSRECARIEGILVGISAGAALCAAWKTLQTQTKNTGKLVVILPDTGERYLSTDLFKK